MLRLRSLVYCAALVLSACGGGSGGSSSGPPPGASELSATITPASQPALPSNVPVQVQFSEPVNAGSTQVTGSFLALGPVRQWSADGDTLTLAPPAGGWPRGQGGTLSVQATARSGATMGAPATATFHVPLSLTTGHAALRAIGQADLVTATSGLAADKLSFPRGSVAVAPDGRVFIGEYVNPRILGFASLSAAAADLVLGQPDFVTGTTGVAQGSYARIVQVSIAGGRMAAADAANNRVLLWSTIPAASGALPDVVLGQPGFVTDGFGCTATGMFFPESVVLTPDGKLLVADSDNHRVLVWLTIPTANGTPPDLVLGQSTFTRCRTNDDNQDNANDGFPSARTLRRPSALWSDGQRVVVSDTDNNRVLVWHTFPTANFQPAALVLGQGAFDRARSNDDNQDGATDAASARTLWIPSNGVHSNGVQLAVADSGNNRVLVWNTFPTSNFQPADAVLGQSNFTSVAAATSATGMSAPAGLLFHHDKLLVTDRLNHRVLVFQSP